MARAIWKGAISFGLVHIPVSLTSAVSTKGVDFDWLDERTMDPVGYKRINKVTGKVVTKEHIVKGVEYDKGHYVIIDEDDIKAALPEATQTIDIFAFVEREEIPWINFYKPYFLSPGRRGEKVYALLRTTLEKTQKVALAHVVIRTKQNLAAVIPYEGALVVMLLRWPDDVQAVASLDLNKAALEAKLSTQEIDMAEQLVKQMSAAWQPDEYVNTFDEDIMALVEQKAEKGEIETVESADTGERGGAEIIDLTEMLKRSLGQRTADKKSPAKRGTSSDAQSGKRSGTRSKSSSGGSSKTGKKTQRK